MGIFTRQKDKDFAEIMVSFNNVIVDLRNLASRRNADARDAKAIIEEQQAIAADAEGDANEATSVADKLAALITPDNQSIAA